MKIKIRTFIVLNQNKVNSFLNRNFKLSNLKNSKVIIKLIKKMIYSTRFRSINLKTEIKSQNNIIFKLMLINKQIIYQNPHYIYSIIKNR